MTSRALISLSPTVENYLKHLFAQQQLAERRLLPMGKLAAAMGVTPGTATAMVKTLVDYGLVQYEPRDGVWDVRAVGAGNLAPGRPRSLTGRGRWAAMVRAYEQLRDAAGVLPVTIEVIYGEAWAGSGPRSRVTGEGDIAVPLTELRPATLNRTRAAIARFQAIL